MDPSLAKVSSCYVFVLLNIKTDITQGLSSDTCLMVYALISAAIEWNQWV